ncbi:MAG: putative manganese-dependent inorganic diphosphatase [Lachnospiraceae bacterium]|nr:putative manganese-dependent inorganic diphosphatase [Lachnospiraceae bacterium]
MKETVENKKVWVIGHKNPDTDSICAAIAYADLKNQTEGNHFEAKRAGQINEETRYVLDYFQVEEPELVKDAGAQIKDIEYRRTEGVSSHISIKRAWELMKTLDVVSLPITRPDNTLDGMIVTGDIAKSYMDVLDNDILSTARTQFKNIVETLNGVMVTGNEHGYFIRGKVVVAAATPDLMEEYIDDDDVVILGDRYESQFCAVEMNASCIIVCSNAKITKTIIQLAKEKDCMIISTPYDTFTVARLINQSMPIKYIMKKENLITFEVDDYVDDVKEVMSKVRHRDFPVLTEDGYYAGMISRRNLLSMQKKQLILVDHNEKSQAVDGIDGAEILEIIDHHRLGSLETISPVFFRNQPLGCTSTIIYQMYREKGVEVSEKIAGLLLAAIISDTLMFRSPTCTEVDKQVAEELARIAGEDIEALAKAMFEAGSDFKNKTKEELFYQDFKTFHVDECTFGVAQLSAMSQQELSHVKRKLNPYLETAMGEQKLDMVFVLLTDILAESSEVIYAGDEAEELLVSCYGEKNAKGKMILKGVVSRKKQLIPTLIAGIQQKNGK